MSDAARASEITQADIDALLSRLKLLREQIEQVRAEIAAIEHNVRLASDDYEAATGSIRQENERLQAEMRRLQNQIEGKQAAGYTRAHQTIDLSEGVATSQDLTTPHGDSSIQRAVRKMSCFATVYSYWTI